MPTLDISLFKYYVSDDNFRNNDYYFATNTSNHTRNLDNFISRFDHDSSFFFLRSRQDETDASIIRIDTSLGEIDIEIGNHRNRLDNFDVSFGIHDIRFISTDASLALRYLKTEMDASSNYKNQDASLGNSISLRGDASCFINVLNMNTKGYSLSLVPGTGSSYGGDLILQGGGSLGLGGNTFICGGNGAGANEGNVYMNYYGSGITRGDLFVGRSATFQDYTLNDTIVTIDGSVINGAVAVFKNSHPYIVSTGNHRRVLDLYANTGYSNVTDFIRFYVGGSGDGYVSNTSGTMGFVQESDRDLKKNIKPTKVNALDILNNLEVYDYEWKDKERKKLYGSQTGLIAQQALNVFPNIVSYGENLRIGYEPLHPIYIRAIQQLTNEINELKAELKKLKTNDQ